MSIAHVQSGQNGFDGTGQTSVGRAYSSAVTAGSLLIAVVTWWTQTSTAPTLSDSVNGSWTIIGSPVTTGPTQVSVIAYRANTAAGTPTVTASWGTAVDYPAISTYEFTGAATSAPVDVSATASGTGTAVSLGAMTLAGAGELVFMTTNPGAFPASVTPGSGMTAGQASLDPATGFGFFDHYGVVASAGSFTPAATMSTSTGWKARGTAFKAAGGTNATLTVAAPPTRFVAAPVTLTAASAAALPVGAAVSRFAAAPVALAAVANAALTVGAARLVLGARNVPLLATAYRYATSVSADGRYFLDQNANPILVHGDSPWSMMVDLSSSEVDTYLANRAALGTNMLLCSLIGCVANGGGNDNGATYDGVLPFTSGDITTPNSTYWARMDSYVDKAAALGVTLLVYPIDGWNTKSGTVFAGKSDADCQTYGQWLATRWASKPNIVWGFGGDYDGTTVGTAADSKFNACLTGIRAAGDTRPCTIQLNYYRSNSFDSSYWEQRVDFSFVYTYFPTYEAVSAARSKTWNTALGKPATRPALFGEGEYDGSHIDGGSALAVRRQAGWALTSGAAGCFTGQEGVWQFNSGWASLLSSAQSTQFAAIVATVRALTKWHLLDPAQASTLVTAGRGSAYTFGSQADTTYNTDSDYVTAAVTGDKSLAVIYNPDTSTRSITISASAVGANPTLRRADPSTGASTGMTWTTTPTASTNAAGDRDWLFIIEADAVIDAGLIVGPGRARFAAPPIPLAGTSGASLVVGAAWASLTAGSVALSGTSNATLPVGASTLRVAAGDVSLTGVANAGITVGSGSVRFVAAGVTMYAGSAADLPVGPARLNLAVGPVALTGVANVALTVGPACVTFTAGPVALFASQPNASLPTAAALVRLAAAPVALSVSSDAQLPVGTARLQLSAAPVSLSGTGVAELLVGAARTMLSAGPVQLRTPDATMPIAVAAARLTAGAVALGAAAYPAVRRPTARIRPNPAQARIRP